MLTNVSLESDAFAVCFDVARRSGVHGKRVTLIQSTKGRIRPMTLISLMQKPSNFPLQCHRAGNIGLKTPSFLLLSTHVRPQGWMKSDRDALANCTIEIEGEREREASCLDVSPSVPQWTWELSSGEPETQGGVRSQLMVCWWTTWWWHCTLKATSPVVCLWMYSFLPNQSEVSELIPSRLLSYERAASIMKQRRRRATAEWSPDNESLPKINSRGDGPSSRWWIQ